MDIIEVFNAKIEDQALNDRAAELAGAFSLPGGAGSDAHDAPGVGAAYLEMPDFDGPAGFLACWSEKARVTGDFRPHAPRYPPERPDPIALSMITNTSQAAQNVRLRDDGDITWEEGRVIHRPIRCARRSRW